MSYKLGDIVIDRTVYGFAEDFSGNPLYVLSHLSDATINVTATSKDAVDENGTLVKRFWTGKTGDFSANNAMLNLNVVQSSAGGSASIASESNVLVMPKIITVAAGTTVTLTGFVDGTVTCNAYSANGTMGDSYSKAATASDTEFGLTTAGVFTPPTDSEQTQFIVKYKRKVTSGAIVKNRANKFPDTVKLTLKVLAVDPCSSDTVKSAYIELPSFQPSPETSIALTTDSQLAYAGSLQTAFCSTDKELYSFYWADEEDSE